MATRALADVSAGYAVESVLGAPGPRNRLAFADSFGGGATDETAPSAPVFTGAFADAPYVDLEWTESTDDTTAQDDIVYELHWSPSALASFVPKVTLTGVNAHYGFADPGRMLGPGTYYFRLRARDEAGNVSDESNELSAVLVDAGAATGDEPLQSIEVLGPRSIRVNWLEKENDWSLGDLNRYLIHVASADNVVFSEANVRASPQANGNSYGEPQSFDLTGLTPNTHYYIRVYHLDRWGVRSGGTVELDAITEDEEASAKPQIGNYAPAPGTARSKNDAVSFDVTDTSGTFRRIIVTARMSNTGVDEVVHNGTEFRGLYINYASRIAISNGYRYTVARSGGWPPGATVTFMVYAVDAEGFEG